MNPENSEYCRVCMARNVSFKSLDGFFRNSEQKLADLLFFCTGVRIHDADAFSKSICRVCVKRLEDAYEFRAQTLATQHYLASTEGSAPLMPTAQVKLEPPQYWEDELASSDGDAEMEETYEEDAIATGFALAEIKNEGDESSETVPTIRIVKSSKPKTEPQTPTPFQCDLCGRYYSRKDKLKEHIKRHHSGSLTIHNCSKCKRSFRSEEKLQSHHDKEHNDTTRRNYMCPICGQLFRQSSGMNKHLKWKHTDELWQCEICGKKMRFYSRQLHMVIHTGEKPFRCDVEGCEAAYPRPSQLREHRVVAHDPQVDLECPICGKRGFKTKARVKQHVQVVHGQASFRCNYCEASFKAKAALKEHVNAVHEGNPRPKDKTCAICGKGFAKPSLLASHMRQHSGERVRCPEFSCNSTFTSEECLKKHLKTVHVDQSMRERNHKCSYCGKGFYTAYHRRVHENNVHQKMKMEFLATQNERMEEVPCSDEINAHQKMKMEFLATQSERLEEVPCSDDVSVE